MSEYRICISSDTHGRHEMLQVPPCDLLIFCGDFTNKGNEDQARVFSKWLNRQPAKHKVLIFGNHEVEIVRKLPKSRECITEECPDCHILCNSVVEIDDFVIYGSLHPFKCIGKLNIDPKKKLIVATHAPPLNIMDDFVVDHNIPVWEFYNAGNYEVNKFCKMNDVKLVCFGHSHYDFGVLERDGTTFVNSAFVDEIFTPRNKLIQLLYKDGKFTQI